LSAPIRHYLRAPSLTVGGAAAFLRAAYVLAFMGQVAAAVLVGVLVVLLALTLFAYGLGFLLTGRLGRVAASEAFEEPDAPAQ